ncbi:head decoration protein [Sansalvadorimonas verongulae]|uniref:head decoration protein n=1 Tax=Sansalvadorimonas verongulae TaxID=2172824 RepID=UPI0012BB9CED|nr:head decoration protein [Sansalvadorimonas verongulae]MTI15141.1 head decoration protein [Sansalvadorimonas verongulae]
MATLTESVHTGEFLVSEANNTLSREQVELAPSLMLYSGTVLGKNTATGIYSPVDPAADDGSQMAAGVLYNNTQTDATGGEAVLIARLAEVDASLLIWPDGITDEQKATAITELGALDIALR